MHRTGIVASLVLQTIQTVATVLLSLLVKEIIKFAQRSYRSAHIADQLQHQSGGDIGKLNGNSDSSAPDVWRGYVMAVGYGLLLIALSAVQQWAVIICIKTGVRIRIQLSSLIFDKALRIGSKQRERFSLGKLVNLISNDAPSLERGLAIVPAMVAAFIQMLLALALLIATLGVAALPGCLVLSLFFPFQRWTAKRSMVYQTQLSAATDERIKLTRETLQGIRVVKSFAYEQPTLQRIARLRHRELGFIRTLRLYTSIATVLVPAMGLFAVIVMVIVYAAINERNGDQHTLDPAVVFTAFALVQSIRLPLTFVPGNIGQTIQSIVAVQRFEHFLLGIADHPPLPEPDATAEYALDIRNASFTWNLPADEPSSSEPRNKEQPSPAEPSPAEQSSSSSKPSASSLLESSFILQSIDLQVARGSLVAVVGSIGSGKSSLLSAIMGEMTPIPPAQPIVYGGSIGLATQTAWIQNGTVRDNITFGQPFDAERYAAITRACQLRPDFAQLPDGDLTSIGERGVTLSGGQKQRISVARLLYYSPDILLLDDPLSAVDAHVGRAMFDECIAGDAPLAHGKTRILVTHQLSVLPRVDHVVCLDGGRIVEQGSYSELMEQRGALYDMVMVYNSHGALQHSSSADTAQSDGSISQAADSTEPASPAFRSDEKHTRPLMRKEERAVGAVALTVYQAYLAAAGGWLWLGPMALAVILSQAAFVGTDVWLTAWISRQFASLSTGGYIAVYVSLGVLYCLLLLAFRVLSLVTANKASAAAHSSALRGIVSAPLVFYDSTPLGQILSRFSSDVYTLDMEFSETLRLLVENVAGIFGPLVLTAIMFPWQLLVIAAAAAAFARVARMSVEGGRELKRLESVTRSPMYAHFNEILSGADTYAMYGRQKTAVAECEELIDRHCRVYFIVTMMLRWVGVRAMSIAGILTMTAAIFAVVYRKSTLPSLVGLIVGYSLALANQYSWVIRYMCDMEQKGVSVERLSQYAHNVEREPGLCLDESDAGPAPWQPQSGTVEFRDVVFRYRRELEPVLHGVSFRIEDGEKIGVVGRSGGGKSSLVQVLTRLYALDGAGCVLIDGTDISTIGLQALRSSIALIPQDPVLFHGTVRSNLDPFGRFDDADLNHVLGAVGLAGQRDIALDSAVVEGASNLSTGQRQLLCLARAMLVKARIVVLDEATASVDAGTDVQIQRAVRSDFRSCTVITIAHRLNTIMDYDRVLVMNAGRVVEMDTPQNLLAQPTSFFSQLVAKADIKR
ncbi:P-loop containing nucleoside triphosphate hydrolase protein [Ramicandelaber brevisporus]|nr:P-loop containing nucleoside triphosphate hydrolase protein [Ramicandelaber brevisporus]